MVGSKNDICYDEYCDNGFTPKYFFKSCKNEAVKNQFFIKTTY